MQGTTGRENRRHPRIPREDTLTLRALDSTPPFPDHTLYATTVDISASGLQIFIQDPLLIRQRVDISIALSGEQHPFRLRGRVNRITELDDPDEPEGFLAGIELTDDSPDMETWRQLFRGKFRGMFR